MDDELGRQIQRARKAVDLTQAQLGERLGVGQTAVAAWEGGQNTPDARQLLTLQRVLGVRFGEPLPPASAQALAEAAGEFRAFAAMATQLAAQATESAERLSAQATPGVSEVAETEELPALLPVARASARARRRQGHR